MYDNLATLAVFAFVFSVIAGRVERSTVSGPMIFIALSGTGEKLETKLFLAWFGPWGLATIVFFIIVANEHLPAESIIKHVVVCTITLCVVAHGMTANAWAKGIGRRLSQEPVHGL